MYDAAAVDNIPADAAMVGYYIDGAYVPSAAQLARFRGAILVPIAVLPSTNKGIVFDGPPDNSTWPRVVDWVVMRRAAGVDPTVYTDADQWSAGLAEFRARGVAPPHWWIAKWDGVQQLIAGAVAHQYQGSEHGGYDRSVVADYWPGVDPGDHPAPAPAPAPMPVIVEEDDVAFIIDVTPDPVKGTGTGAFLVSGAMIAYITDVTSIAAFRSMGLKEAAVTKAQYDTLVAASAALKGNLSGSLAVSGNLAVA